MLCCVSAQTHIQTSLLSALLFLKDSRITLFAELTPRCYVFRHIACQIPGKVGVNNSSAQFWCARKAHSESEQAMQTYGFCLGFHFPSLKTHQVEKVYSPLKIRFICCVSHFGLFQSILVLTLEDRLQQIKPQRLLPSVDVS